MSKRASLRAPRERRKRKMGAAAMGRLGGKNRWKNIDPLERSRIMRAALQARWEKAKTHNGNGHDADLAALAESHPEIDEEALRQELEQAARTMRTALGETPLPIPGASGTMAFFTALPMPTLRAVALTFLVDWTSLNDFARQISRDDRPFAEEPGDPEPRAC